MEDLLYPYDTSSSVQFQQHSLLMQRVAETEAALRSTLDIVDPDEQKGRAAPATPAGGTESNHPATLPTQGTSSAPSTSASLGYIREVTSQAAGESQPCRSGASVGADGLATRPTGPPQPDAECASKHGLAQSNDASAAEVEVQERYKLSIEPRRGTDSLHADQDKPQPQPAPPTDVPAQSEDATSAGFGQQNCIEHTNGIQEPHAASASVPIKPPDDQAGSRGPKRCRLPLPPRVPARSKASVPPHRLILAARVQQRRDRAILRHLGAMRAAAVSRSAGAASASTPDAVAPGGTWRRRRAASASAGRGWRAGGASSRSNCNGRRSRSNSSRRSAPHSVRRAGKSTRTRPRQRRAKLGTRKGARARIRASSAPPGHGVAPPKDNNSSSSSSSKERVPAAGTHPRSAPKPKQGRPRGRSTGSRPRHARLSRQLPAWNRVSTSQSPRRLARSRSAASSSRSVASRASSVRSSLASSVGRARRLRRITTANTGVARASLDESTAVPVAAALEGMRQDALYEMATRARSQQSRHQKHTRKLRKSIEVARRSHEQAELALRAEKKARERLAVRIRALKATHATDAEELSAAKGQLEDRSTEIAALRRRLARAEARERKHEQARQELYKQLHSAEEKQTNQRKARLAAEARAEREASRAAALEGENNRLRKLLGWAAQTAVQSPVVAASRAHAVAEGLPSVRGMAIAETDGASVAEEHRVGTSEGAACVQAHARIPTGDAVEVARIQTPKAHVGKREPGAGASATDGVQQPQASHRVVGAPSPVGAQSASRVDMPPGPAAAEGRARAQSFVRALAGKSHRGGPNGDAAETFTAAGVDAATAQALGDLSAESAEATALAAAAVARQWERLNQAQQLPRAEQAALQQPLQDDNMTEQIRKPAKAVPSDSPTFATKQAADAPPSTSTSRLKVGQDSASESAPRVAEPVASSRQASYSRSFGVENACNLPILAGSGSSASHQAATSAQPVARAVPQPRPLSSDREPARGRGIRRGSIEGIESIQAPIELHSVEQHQQQHGQVRGPGRASAGDQGPILPVGISKPRRPRGSAGAGREASRAEEEEQSSRAHRKGREPHRKDAGPDAGTSADCPQPQPKATIRVNAENGSAAVEADSTDPESRMDAKELRRALSSPHKADLLLAHGQRRSIVDMHRDVPASRGSQAVPMQLQAADDHGDVKQQEEARPAGPGIGPVKALRPASSNHVTSAGRHKPTRASSHGQSVEARQRTARGTRALALPLNCSESPLPSAVDRAVDAELSAWSGLESSARDSGVGVGVGVGVGAGCGVGGGSDVFDSESDSSEDTSRLSALLQALPGDGQGEGEGAGIDPASLGGLRKMYERVYGKRAS